MNHENRYSPSYFVAMFRPKERDPDNNRSYNNFVETTNVEPNRSITTKSYVVHLASSRATRIATDKKNQVTLVLHGEIYNVNDNQPEFLAGEYVKHGFAFSHNINGSFAILLIDKQNDTVAVIIDRVNTRRVFYSKYQGDHWLSTSLYLHPTAGVDMDPVGLGCYLANGVVHNNRTLFQGIRILERACIHKLTEHCFRATRYWSYEFNNSYSGVDEATLRAELSNLLIESVRIRLVNNPKVFLSLSGGYDATGLLGILGSALNIPNVECFSYALGEPKSTSDEYVARRMAAYLGYNHKIIRSYKGNPVHVIEHNANWGEGLANFCEEVDAWTELAGHSSTTNGMILLVADECFGWTDLKLDSETDVLHSVSIYDFSGLYWLRHLLPTGVYNMLIDGLNQAISDVLRRCPSSDDYHDHKDFLYLDQRLSNVILPWREFFPGRFIQVRNPFLDNSILDFMTKLPSRLRRGKRLYKSTIRQMFPQLFRFERATTCSYVPNWDQQFTAAHHEIETHILSEKSQLDTMIPPRVILKLLRQNRALRDSTFSPYILPFKVAGRLLRMPMGNKLRACFPSFPRIVIDRTTLLKRLLVLRSFLCTVDNSLHVHR